MRKGLGLISAVLTLLLLVTALAVPAFAQKTDKKPTEKPEETMETTVPDGEPFTGETDLITRDLLFDKEGRKQFISVQDRDGNLFYIVIDYDAPVNEAEEQYKTYFLNPVDPEDLAALTGQEETKPAVCICTEKCRPGQIDMNCPVCAVNVAECAGMEPADQQEPTVPDQTEPQEPEGKAPQKLTVLVGLAALAAGGVVVVLLRLRKSRTKAAAREDPDDDSLYEEEEEYTPEEAPEEKPEL